MRKGFYTKLAVQNLKKNRRTYVPYLLTCIITVVMFYMMGFLATNKGLDGPNGSASIRSVLQFGTVIIGIFAVIFLFYTNGFLMKQRKQEIGLFNILGMEKRHIAKVLSIEMIITGFLSLIIGLGFGIFFSKLMLMFLGFLLQYEISFGFQIEPSILIISICLFSGIFLCNLCFNLAQIHMANPIELLHGGEKGEREPKSKWLFVIFGVGLLGGGYTIANVVQSPLKAIPLFFLAVLFVTIGTYCLFTAGSILFLKVLKKNKKFYYQTKHFTAVSGMIYRMKQNAVGLANICILSTAVLLMISSTVSLYIGMEDILKTRYPKDITLNVREFDEEGKEGINTIVQDALSREGIVAKDFEDFESLGLGLLRDGNRFFMQQYDGEYTFSKVSELVDVVFITNEEYQRLTGKALKLDPKEVCVYDESQLLEGDEIIFADMSFAVKQEVDNFFKDKSKFMGVVDSIYVVFENGDIIREVEKRVYNRNIGDSLMLYQYHFNVDASDDIQRQLISDIQTNLSTSYPNAYIDAKIEGKESFVAVYGGLFFLGIFLGALFIMATVLIMYYKQISEGYEDKKRFEIMRKVGMSKEEVKKSIRTQVLMVFFLPLIVAVVHIGAAFRMVTKLLAVLNLTNVPLFIACTIATIVVFAIFYGIVYGLTAKVYYKIVG